MIPTVTILEGDVLDQLRTLPDESVHCCVTSPPYWGLRDYGVEGQIGLEKTPEEYVAKMVEVFREVRRVLRSDGTLWLNIGDSYACTPVGSFNGGGIALTGRDLSAHSEGSKRDKLKASGLKPKDLCGIPWRVAFALQADGWWLRSEIIWHKPNPMPESVTDRPTKSHEQIFLLAKSASYLYDSEAVREEALMTGGGLSHNGDKHNQDGQGSNNSNFGRYMPSTRNKRSVWTVPSFPFPDAHFATYPPDLIKPCILAGTSAKGCCPKCGAPWERQIARDFQPSSAMRNAGVKGMDNSNGWGEFPRGITATSTVGWEPTCECGCPEVIPCTVLEPFGGSFTTCAVSLELGRSSIGIELNPKYITLGRARCAITPGLNLA